MPEHPYRAGPSEEEIRRMEAERRFREIETRSEEYARLFDRQVETLIERGYAEAADMTQDRFKQLFATLKREARDLAATGPEIKEGHIPFVIVLRERLLSLEKKIPLMEFDGKKGYTVINLSEFETAKGVEIPDSLAYLIVDVENGKAMKRRPPAEAVKQFKKEGRSPLTAEEGVAIVTQYPEILKDHYLDLPGSRRGADKVANLWLDDGKPKLGRDYSDNSSSKWGSASCGSRVGP